MTTPTTLHQQGRVSDTPRRLSSYLLALIWIIAAAQPVTLHAALAQAIDDASPVQEHHCKSTPTTPLTSLSIASAPAGPSSTKTLEPIIDEESYPTAIDAVIAASHYFNPLSIAEDREYIGAILQHKTLKHFIYTVSSGHTGADKVSARIQVPEQYEITAFWHTHGNHHWTRKYFSDVDTALVKHWQLPFYMADARGRLRIFEPQSPTLSIFQARKLGLGSHAGYAKGKTVKYRNQSIKLATNMDDWLARHQAATTQADQSASSRCENWANHDTLVGSGSHSG